MTAAADRAQSQVSVFLQKAKIDFPAFKITEKILGDEK
jgi:hypothetical protein